MHRRFGPRLASQSLLLRASLWALLSAVFTAIVIQWSFREGRLTLPIGFDDIGYFHDAATRLNELYVPGNFWKDFRANPPHSPFSTFLAMASFMVFGMKDWAPYAGNALLVFGYLAFADHILRGLALCKKFVAWLLLLSVPMLAMAVHEFRPDHACALLTVIACFLILEKPIVYASFKRVMLIGFIFGLALLAKPTTFPGTLIFMIATLALGTASDYFGNRRHLRLRKIGSAWLICIVSAVVVALPYYFFAFERITQYIYDTLFGDFKGIWQTKGSLQYRLFYYLTSGWGGRSMLGKHVWIMAVILVTGLVFYHKRYVRRERVRFTVFALFVFGAFVLVTANQVKSVFLGLTFQTALVFAAFYVIRNLLVWETLARPVHQWVTLGLIGITVAGVLLFRWPQRYGDFSSANTLSQKGIINGVYDTIVNADKLPHARVLIEGIGSINPSIMGYFAARDLRDIDFYAVGDTPKIEAHVVEWDRADFMVLSEPDNLLTADFLLAYPALDKLNELIRTRRDWKEIAHFVYPPSGRGFYILKRVPLEWTGWDDATGLAPLEGPYPQFDNKTVHWGLGPATHLHLADFPIGADVLHLSFRNGWPDEALTVTLDGKAVFSQVLAHPPDSFVDLKIPLTLSGGPHDLQLIYSRSEQGTDLPRTILFRELAIEPAP